MERECDYLIIGAGMAGESAARALREADSESTIGMLGSDPHPPYDRPPLTKKLWKGGKEADIWRPVEKARAGLQLSRSAKKVDRRAHVVHCEDGDAWHYRKLLIATGGTPRSLSSGGEGFIYYRTFDDYRRLRESARPGAHVVVVGGGFIGSELAAALAMNQCKVTMVFPDKAIGARVYPQALAESVTQYFRDKGVEVRANVKVDGGSVDPNGGTVKLAGGDTLHADAVVAGLGITPNTALAEDAGLEVDNGIVVNDHLQTSDPDIYAAGDVACFPAPSVGKRLRVEHEDAANNMGAHAGKCMAGEDAPYLELPFFYSDLFDLGYEAVGTLDSRLETVEQWVKPYREGVVYYLADGRVRGVLLWNTWDQVNAARALIAASGPFDAHNVVGRLPAKT